MPVPDKYEDAVVYAMSTILSPQFESDEDKSIFKDILRDVFPLSADPGNSKVDPDLVQAVKSELKVEGLQPTEMLVDKILQLFLSLGRGHNVMLVGPSGSGKTTVYKTLCHAINKLHMRKFEVEVSDELQPTKSLAGLQQHIPKVCNSI